MKAKNVYIIGGNTWMPDSSDQFALISRLNLFHLDIYNPLPKNSQPKLIAFAQGGKGQSFKTFYWWQVSLVLKLTEIIIVNRLRMFWYRRWKWSNKVWAMENSQVKLITRCGKSATVKFCIFLGRAATPGPTLLAKKTELSRWKRGLRLVSF